VIKLESNKMQKAIAKAKQVHPRVRQGGERTFTVTSSRKTHIGQVLYTVTFVVANGHKLGECTCKATGWDGVLSPCGRGGAEYRDSISESGPPGRLCRA
jgi:hypothetical protein